ncbi:MAG: SMP-30/gluconolactonase/LRE family protein [Pseudomonadota bacterium]
MGHSDTFTPLSLDRISFVGADLARPECAMAHHSGTVFVPDWTEPGGVTVIAPDGTCVRHLVNHHTPAAEAALDGPLRGNGICLLDGGDFLIAHLGDETGGVFRLSVDGTLDTFLTHAEGAPLPPSNFVTVDEQDRVWITVSTRKVPRGAAYRSDVADGFVVFTGREGGEGRIVADGLGYTNECLLHPDGKRLFVNETFARRLTSYAVATDGTLSDRKTVASFEAGTFPDGLAFDENGDAWITSIVSNRVLRVSNRGTEIYLQDVDPDHLDWVEQAWRNHTMGRPHLDKAAGQVCKNVSNLAFCGPDLSKAVLGCLLDDRLPVIDMPVAGHQPVHWTFNIEPLKTALRF